MAALLRRGLTEEGHAADVARTRRRRALDGARRRVRRDRARRDAARAATASRSAGGCASGGIWAPVLMLTARDAVEDRVAGPRRRRRRLPDEAVLVRRAARAAARARPPRRGRSGRRCSRSATSASTRRRAGSGAARPRSRSRRRSSRCSRRSCAGPGEVLSRYQLLEHAWDYGYENRSNVVDVYVRYLREKIDRPFGRDSLETVRGAGYRLRAGDEPAADPRPADARLRARDGARARGDRARSLYVRLQLVARRGARRGARRRSSAAGSRSRRRATAQPIADSARSAADERSHRRGRAPRRAASLARRRRRRSTRGPPARLRAPRRRADGRSPWSSRRSLDDRDEALAALLAELLLDRAARARSLASLAGYALAAAALRPVEAMRRRAGEISAATSRASGCRCRAARDEIRGSATTLNEMLGRLEAALERERRFVADASHELRTPLALLKTELELALRRPRSPEELEAALRSAAEETDRLCGWPRTCSCSRARRGRLALRREPIAARELLESVARRFGAAAPSSADDALEVARWRRPTGSGSSRRSATSSTTRSATAAPPVRLERRGQANGAVELHVADDGAGLPARLPRRTPSSASAAPTRRGRSRAPGSGSRSSRPSPAPTAARRPPGTSPAAGPR